MVLEAQQLDDGTWRGHYDLRLPASGSCGRTKPMPLRGDAMASAAHPVAAHCRRVVDAAGREVLRWLTYLDLL